jgi:hypothetical protein
MRQELEGCKAVQGTQAGRIGMSMLGIDDSAR